MGWIIEVAGKTDVGCVRADNEDNLGYDGRCGVYVVCDGMGGQAAGEVASKLAVEAMLRYFRDSARHGHYPRIGSETEGLSAHAQILGSAIAYANNALLRASSDNPAYTGMGATLDSVLVGSKGAYSIGHVGDSRIYLVRGETIKQLTCDHSFVMEQVRRGLISQEEARRSDAQNVVLRALGAEEDLNADLEDRHAEPGDVLVVCSDGLTRELSDGRICELISRARNLESACDELVEEARQSGGGDNITVLLLRFQRHSWLVSAWHWITGKGLAALEPF